MTSVGKKLGDPLRDVRFSEVNEIVYEEEDEEETRCGIGPFQGEWLQRFANKKAYIAVYSIIGTFQSMFFTYFVAVLTTVEKQFRFRSRTTGIILSGNEVSQILLSLLLSYFGAHGHRPRLLALGMVCSAFACFIVVIPHLVYGPDVVIKSNLTVYLNKTSLCSDITAYGTKDCSLAENSDSYMPGLLMFLSQFVSGIGSTMFYTLGIPYLDDNTKQKQAPMLMGIMSSLRLVGPTLGFVMASACLKLYVNVTETPLFGMTDPRWIGAWWLGFVAVGICLLFASFFIACFPRRLPKKRVVSAAITYRQISRQSSTRSSSSAKEPMPKLKDFPAAIKRLLVNKALMWNNVAGVAYVFAISGYITFLPKYMEVQYQQTAVTASIVNAAVGIFFMAAGMLLGGYYLSKKQPNAVNVQVYCCITGLIYIAGFTVFAFVGCDVKPLHGLTSGDGIINPVTPCNMNCNCNATRFVPVCAADGEMNFFSSCHAGCTEFSVNTLGKKEYSDCSCLAFHNETSNTWSLGKAIEGYCDAGCTQMFWIYIFATGIMKFLSGTARVGGMIMSFRCVDPKDKAFALGLGTVFVSLFAFIPAPIAYGSLIDKACTLWHTDECGRKGHCWLYDPVSMRMFLHLITAGCIVIGVIADGIVCIHVRDLDLYGDNDKSEKLKGKGLEKSSTYTTALSTPVDEFAGLASDLEVLPEEAFEESDTFLRT